MKTKQKRAKISWNKAENRWETWNWLKHGRETTETDQNVARNHQTSARNHQTGRNVAIDLQTGWTAVGNTKTSGGLLENTDSGLICWRNWPQLTGKYQYRLKITGKHQYRLKTIPLGSTLSWVDPVWIQVWAWKKGFGFRCPAWPSWSGSTWVDWTRPEWVGVWVGLLGWNVFD